MSAQFVFQGSTQSSSVTATDAESGRATKRRRLGLVLTDFDNNCNDMSERRNKYQSSRNILQKIFDNSIDENEQESVNLALKAYDKLIKEIDSRICNNKCASEKQ
jgi:hypothetical protein